MTAETLTPQKAAYRLTRVIDTFAAAHGTNRFPVAADLLAREAASIFKWKDPITEVKAADIQKFEGALFANDDRSKWMLLYNDRLRSPGRIRFTQAHELGHYLLHRLQRDAFRCSEQDMVDWSDNEANLEAQADLFASTLLMPLDDYRRQTTERADFEYLGYCADRYGVSLTAATLKWLEWTDECAVFVVSKDGFIDWARSSTKAMRAGAFLRTRRQVIPVPAKSIAADSTVNVEKKGRSVEVRAWFPKAEEDEPLREMKISADNYDAVFTLLILPRSASAWPARDEE